MRTAIPRAWRGSRQQVHLTNTSERGQPPRSRAITTYNFRLLFPHLGAPGPGSGLGHTGARWAPVLSGCPSRPTDGYAALAPGDAWAPDWHRQGSSWNGERGRKGSCRLWCWDLKESAARSVGSEGMGAGGIGDGGRAAVMTAMGCPGVGTRCPGRGRDGPFTCGGG